MKGFLIAFLPCVILAHFSLTWPPSRHYGSQESAGLCMSNKDLDLPGRNGTCLWFSDYCMIGCESCSGNETDWIHNINTGCKKDMGQPIAPVLPDEARTWWNFVIPKEAITNPTYGRKVSVDVDEAKKSSLNPWFNPGTAPLYSPCGMAGGAPKNYNGVPGDGAYPPAGVAQGFDGRNLPPNPDANTIWERGSVQEVSFDIFANHGGGDSYRLCKKADEFHFETEECFQDGQLDFVGDITWIQKGADKNNRTAIPAKRYTTPEGKMWSVLQVPACGNILGGNSRGMGNNTGMIQAGEECLTPQFESPIPGLFGMGRAQCVYPILGPNRSNVGAYFPGDIPCDEERLAAVTELWNINVVDTVQIPADLEPGEYVLSWRHDSEQSPQIWANCADVTII